MLHIKALFIGTGILSGAMAIAVLTSIAISNYGAIVFAIPFALLLAYALGRMCLEIWGSLYR